MPTQTDPARELSDLISDLSLSPNVQLDHELARNFGVEVWSPQFHRIIAIILDRFQDLLLCIDMIALDEDYKSLAKENIQFIRRGFLPDALRVAANHASANFFSQEKVMPLSMLSGQIRPIRSYPKVDDAEQAELLEMLNELIGWLEEHQVSEQDFIRQALLDGLGQLRFRVERIKWLGWGYAMQGLRDVIAAYFALERGFPPDGSNTTAEAILKRVGEFVRSFFEKVGYAKDMVERGDFMLRAYGAVHLAVEGKTTIAGLLTHAG